MDRDMLYHRIVNRIPGIRDRYRNFRSSPSGQSRARAWSYLAMLYARYYLLREKTLAEPEDAGSDQGRMLPEKPESQIGREAQPGDPVRLAGEMQAYDVISFDVFDTLLLRKVKQPADVFWLLERRFSVPGLKKLRVEAEMYARQTRHDRHGDWEVTLAEIWEVLSCRTGIPQEEGMQAEEEAEDACCMANPWALSFVRALRQKAYAGQQLVLCSDMYLSSGRIRALLQRCGYPAFDNCLVSCEYRKSKNTGALFAELRRRYGADRRFLHIGDNAYADGQQAKRQGMAVLHYGNVQELGRSARAAEMSRVTASVYAGIVNSHLYNGLAAESREFEFGYVCGGLFVTGYCQFIHAQAREKGIGRLLFLSRDGDILHKAYCLLYPEERSRCAYVLWSRLVSARLSARRLRSFFLERMIRHKTGQGYCLGDVFRTMELEDMLPAFLEANPFCEGQTGAAKRRMTEESPLDQTSAGLLEQFLLTRWEEVCCHYDEESREARRYYEAQLAGVSSAAAIDVGWVGSGPLTLKLLIEQEWQLPCRICGILAGTCGADSPDLEAAALPLAKGELVSYLFSEGLNRDLWRQHDAGAGHNMLVELLLASPTPSFRGFSPEGERAYRFSTGRETIRAEEIQRGILTFVRQFQAHPLHDMTVSGRDAAAPILLLMRDKAFLTRLLAASGIRPNVE